MVYVIAKISAKLLEITFLGYNKIELGLIYKENL